MATVNVERPVPPPVPLAHWLLRSRREAGLDQAALATACHASRTTIGKWERNDPSSAPTVNQWVAWARACDAEWMLDLGLLFGTLTPGRIGDGVTERYPQPLITQGLRSRAKPSTRRALASFAGP